jgi:hypothetical protein
MEFPRFRKEHPKEEKPKYCTFHKVYDLNNEECI